MFPPERAPPERATADIIATAVLNAIDTAQCLPREIRVDQHEFASRATGKRITARGSNGEALALPAAGQGGVPDDDGGPWAAPNPEPSPNPSVLPNPQE